MSEIIIILESLFCMFIFWKLYFLYELKIIGLFRDALTLAQIYIYQKSEHTKIICHINLVIGFIYSHVLCVLKYFDRFGFSKLFRCILFLNIIFKDINTFLLYKSIFQNMPKNINPFLKEHIKLLDRQILLGTTQQYIIKQTNFLPCQEARNVKKVGELMVLICWSSMRRLVGSLFQ